MRWLVLFSLLWGVPAFGVLAPSVTVEVQVLDEAGASVADAKVRGDFLGVSSADGSMERSWTDSKGRAEITGSSFFPVRLTVQKDGYYPSGARVNTKEVVDGQEHYRDRQVNLMLKEKRNPIPLYARRYSGEIPVAKEWLGFDLERADWVGPYGKGVSADLLFHYDGSVIGFLNAQGKLGMRFSNSSDGMKDITSEVTSFSELKVPHKAPAGGYVTKEKLWTFRIGKGVPSTEYGRDKSKHYFFRVRSSVDADGKIIQANYVKVYQDIYFSPLIKEGAKGVARISFTYYFNPIPNDHNLEFDPNENLFKGLAHDEQVREP